MENEISDLDQLKEQLDKNGHKVEEVNLLFFDMSSTCTGYSLASVNFRTKSAKFLNAGAFWFDDSMDNADKYQYVYNAIVNYFNIVGKVDHFIAEAYMINSKKLMGSQVSIEMHGVVKVALKEIGVGYSSILPQTWRSQLGIKPIFSVNKKGKKERDYKTPTKDYVTSLIQVPPQIKSNVTGNDRTTPSDLYDSLCVGLGFLQKLGITNWDFKTIKFQESIDL